MRVKPAIPVGIVYSQSGPYARIGRQALAGAMSAIEAVNARDDLGFRLEPYVRDPAGNSARYASAALELIREHKCRHILGAITSSSRKEMLPVLDRSESLLWYAFPYEGFEVSDHVLYLGATANQHILPLFDYVLPRLGTSPFLVGSNYVWGWEINRIAREIVVMAGGEPVGECHLPLGDTDVAYVIEQIRERRPDFILSNLLGDSSLAFVHAYAELGRKDPDFAASRRPIVSCNFCEVDAEAIGPDSAGIITTAPFFADAPEMPAIPLPSELGRLSQGFTAPHAAITVLAEAIAASGNEDPREVRRAATSQAVETLHGALQFDARTGHCRMRPWIAMAEADGRFQMLHRSDADIPPDPYLMQPYPHIASLAHGRPTAPQPVKLRVMK